MGIRPQALAAVCAPYWPPPPGAHNLCRAPLVQGCALTPWSGCTLPQVAALAVVFCGSVVAGNASLKYIPVSFNQAVGASTPAFTALFCALLVACQYPPLCVCPGRALTLSAAGLLLEGRPFLRSPGGCPSWLVSHFLPSHAWSCPASYAPNLPTSVPLTPRHTSRSAADNGPRRDAAHLPVAAAHCCRHHHCCWGQLPPCPEPQLPALRPAPMCSRHFSRTQ